MRRVRGVRLLLTGVSFALLIVGLAPAGASSANISRSYRSETAITSGSLVSLDSKRSDFVQPANTGNGSRLLGVAVNGNDSLLAVDATPGNIQVATSGSANALVSTLGGDIKVGDLIGISPFNGVGMKATPGSRIIGLAQTAFNRDNAGATFQTVTDKQGKQQQIAVGLVAVSIAIGTNGDAEYQDLNSLQRFARSITGHTVSTTRIALSIGVVIISLVALITLVYASIYGSIVSVGRNPLAKYAIFRTLASVLGMAALTTFISAATVYLLLR